MGVINYKLNLHSIFLPREDWPKLWPGQFHPLSQFTLLDAIILLSKWTGSFQVMLASEEWEAWEKNNERIEKAVMQKNITQS